MARRQQLRLLIGIPEHVMKKVYPIQFFRRIATKNVQHRRVCCAGVPFLTYATDAIHRVLDNVPVTCFRKTQCFTGKFPFGDVNHHHSGTRASVLRRI